VVRSPDWSGRENQASRKSPASDPSGRDACEWFNYIFFGLGTIGLGFVAPKFVLPAAAMGGIAGLADVGGGCAEPANQDFGVSEYGYGY
jgi:hypothetical protein